MIYPSIPVGSDICHICKCPGCCNRHARYKWRWSTMGLSNLSCIGTSHLVRLPLSVFGKRPYHRTFYSPQLDSTMFDTCRLASPACIHRRHPCTRHFHRSLMDTSAYYSHRRRIRDCKHMFRLHNCHVVDTHQCMKARHKRGHSIDLHSGT